MNEIKIEKYSSYKDSGVEWLGEIPSSWTTKRIKHLFNEINERSFDGSEDLLSVSQYTGVTNKSEKLEDGGMLTNANTLEGYKKVWEGDLVSNIMLAWNGSLGFSPFNGITSPAYSIYRLKTKDVNRYFHYLLRTELYKSEFKRNSSGVIESRLRLYTDDFFIIESILPPKEEQTAIAAFLDRKTALIDQAVDIKQKQIELLKERRQILIHKAVTRGLNAGAKLKDSGVEWIGQIPEGWEVKRLASFGKFSKGGGFSKADLTETGVSAILYGDIYTKYDIQINKGVRFVSSETASKSIKVKKGDLLFTGSGETMEDIGKCVVFSSDEKTVAGGDVIIFEQNQNDNLYLSYVLNTEGAKFEKAKHSKGEIIVHTYGSKLRNIYIPLPQIEEQIEIAEYIKTANAKIAAAISLKEQEIEKLKEYKSTLINSAVTGKIKVSNYDK